MRPNRGLGFSSLAVIGAIALACIVAMAILAPWLAPYDPRLSAGPALLGPSGDHWLGTNDLGQDVLSEWLWAARASLLTAALVTIISTALAWLFGVAAGLSSRLDGAAMGVCDLLLALPAVPLCMLVLSIAGSGRRNVILLLALLSWPVFARVVRAQVRQLAHEPYVEAAQAMGAGRLHVAWRHILPGTLALLPAKLLTTVRFALFGEATLAFLGLGDPASKSWGTMLGWAFNDPLLFASQAWLWRVLPPAASIAIVVLAVTWIGTGLEQPHEHPAQLRRPSAAGRRNASRHQPARHAAQPGYGQRAPGTI